MNFFHIYLVCGVVWLCISSAILLRLHVTSKRELNFFDVIISVPFNFFFWPASILVFWFFRTMEKKYGIDWDQEDK